TLETQEATVLFSLTENQSIRSVEKFIGNEEYIVGVTSTSSGIIKTIDIY
ncbi:unnamed protein product, partial [marine sediment metagenome]